jgi:hypothetical protein
MSSTHLFVAALRRFQAGDFKFRLDPSDLKGVDLEFAEVFNDIANSTQTFSEEVERVSNTSDELNREQSLVQCNSGPYKAVAESINQVISDTILPVSDVVHIIEAVASGDLTHHRSISLGRACPPYRRIIFAVQGIFLSCYLLLILTQAALTEMTTKLHVFAAEITRVIRDVGVEGRLGGQARVQGVDGIWRAITDDVNAMAENLTGQYEAWFSCSLSLSPSLSLLLSLSLSSPSFSLSISLSPSLSLSHLSLSECAPSLRSLLLSLAAISLRR